MDAARVTTIAVPKRRAQELVCDGPVDYVGRHAQRPAPAPRPAIADHPRAHGFSILSRLARSQHLTAAAV
jgi:hypothetical protein